MSIPERLSFEYLVQRAYNDAYSYHGNLEIKVEDYLSHIISIIEKHLGQSPINSVRVQYIGNLHTNDLYLSTACALKSEIAWSHFIACYHKYIFEIANSAAPNTDLARESSDRVLFDLFLPDGSGRSRIASYDGRSSLATWLRVIVIHQVFKERKRKYNNLEALDSIQALEKADCFSIIKMNASVRANRYQSMIWESLEGAIKSLTERESALLLLRYEEELQVTEIARIFSVNPSTITRLLQSIQTKLRKRVISLLSSNYHLNPSAIEECLVDIIENPEYSILHLIQKD